MSIDSEAPRRNLSFTDGETRSYFHDLEPHHKAAAIAIRECLLDKFEDTAMSEESLMLIGLESITLKRTTQDFYIVQATEPVDRPDTLLGGVLRVPGHGFRSIQELHSRYDIVDAISQREQRLNAAREMNGSTAQYPSLAPEPSFDAWYPVVKVSTRQFRHFGIGTGLSAPNRALTSSNKDGIAHTLSAIAKARTK